MIEENSKQVNLISQDHIKISGDGSSITRDKRPPQLTVSKAFSPNHKWKQCKIIGKNISIRSYSAACAFRDKLYLYGGYQILEGSLKDFYSICLDQSETTFKWQEILPKGQTPGRRSKHGLIATKSKIYLIGGLLANNEASNDIYEFDPENNAWELKKPEGPLLPPLESFSVTAVHHNDGDRIIIAFGFNETLSTPSNTVYEYLPDKNKLSILFEGSQKGSLNVPSPRIGSAITTDNNDIYIFGGKNEQTRLNDTWKFSLADYKFKKLKDDGEVPYIRNGHTINFYEGKLYVFGGIHDITWELDDLHIYDLKRELWSTLEQESPRKVQKKNNMSISQGQNTEKDKIVEKNTSKKKGLTETVSHALVRGHSPTLSARQQFSISAYNIQQPIGKGAQSPGKMLDEQRKKVFFLKKTEMLKNFQIKTQQRQKLIILETSSQAMRNSLDVIGNPDPKAKHHEQKLTDFGKQSSSKFLEPLKNNSNIVIGKKPCARDGHISVIIKDQLIIFGGDRHQMSFNDIYKMNLKLAVKEMANQ